MDRHVQIMSTALSHPSSCLPHFRIFHGYLTLRFLFLPRDNINNNNNNNHDNVYGAVIMAEPLREFTRFI